MPMYRLYHPVYVQGVLLPGGEKKLISNPGHRHFLYATVPNYVRGFSL